MEIPSRAIMLQHLPHDARGGGQNASSALTARTLAKSTIASLLSAYVDRRGNPTCPPTADSHSAQPLW